MVVLGALLWSVPAWAESPCDSETVIPEQQEALRSDCEALWAFFTSLDDPGVLDDPDNANAWGAATPLTTWQGVRTGPGGVESIILPSAGLSGALSSELAKIKNLRVLELDNNQLTGPVPSEFGELTNLVYLGLHMNRLSGELPSELGQLKNLTQLVLHSNALTGPIPPELSQLTKLTYLELGGNSFSGVLPPALGNLTALQYLVIHSSDITGTIPSRFGNLTELQHLHLFNNELTGEIPTELSNLTKLQVLNLSNNKLTGPIPPELSQLTKLTYLELGGNSFSGVLPPALGNLTALQYLVIHSSDITGTIPSRFGNLTELQHLHLFNNELTGEIPTELSNLTKLQVLNLSNNKLTGTIPAELGRLTTLTKLHLQNNKLEGVIPSSIKSLEHLDLAISGNPLSNYVDDPLGLIANVAASRQNGLGDIKWEVWLCDNPNDELPLRKENVIRTLNREITRYFLWLSDSRYNPTFEYAGEVRGDSLKACEEAARQETSGGPMLVIDDAGAAGGYAYEGGPVVVGGTAVVQANAWSKPLLTVVAHEIGHHLGFPHSYGGKVYWASGAVYEGDNPMDIMSGVVSLNLTTGTIAVNRYAAGWIDEDQVAVHEVGATAEYELRPLGSGGIQLLVLPGVKQGLFTALGARVAIGYDASIPRQGVEVYRIDQRERACRYPANRTCSGTERRTQPYPPTPAGAGYGDDLYDQGKARLVDHVHYAGDTFEVGDVTVEVIERVGNNYTVRVTDPRTPVTEPADRPPEPEASFAGRFSDDDGSVHEANIETIAALGITLGCNPPDNDRYCPEATVTRSQMMALLARALNLESESEATTSRFSDVPDDAWYLSSLERLGDLGVVEPYDDGTFRPSEPVTRLDMAVFMSRAFSNIVEAAEPIGVFEDVAADSEYAGAVEGILAAGVTTGCSADPLLYCPDKPVRRDQMASFFSRALNG